MHYIILWIVAGESYQMGVYCSEGSFQACVNASPSTRGKGHSGHAGDDDDLIFEEFARIRLMGAEPDPDEHPDCDA